MRILLSAYACKPGVGSEPGVGWRWAMHLAKTHDVIVLTHERFRNDIEPALNNFPGPRPRFVFHETRLLRRVPFNSITALPKYIIWQLSVLPTAIRLIGEARYDVIMHLTMGTFRYPSWLGFLGVPFVFGPAGGGERAPMRFFHGLPVRERLVEFARTALIVSGKFDPLLWIAHSRARLIFARTEQTRQALPFFLRNRVVIRQEIGSDPTADKREPAARLPEEPLRLVMGARLLGWKGVHIAIETMAVLRTRGVCATLDVFGQGHLQEWLTGKLRGLGLDDCVRLRGYVPFEEMQQHMRSAHCFLFPSLHDSGGTVVLEAFGNGLPVVCLDLGGPKDFVTRESGRVVGTAGRGIGEVARALADEIEDLNRDDALRRKLAAGALARGQELSWVNQMDGAMRLINGVLDTSTGSDVVEMER